MNLAIKHIQHDYSPTFKLALVDQIEKDEMTHKQTQDRYDIQRRSTALYWLRKHDQLDLPFGTPHLSAARGAFMSRYPNGPNNTSENCSSSSPRLNRKQNSSKQWSMRSSVTMELAL